ncbi:hypothetical protein TeGR_g3095 [Tetraparma gracilis]|uniref:Uncharacterized protein n=1 Tax=Tetraparma gracilis TaxID=2962635 RepID=A0ABQ6MUF9_9STRA|nr:hypothetical protein TeGR_g3095 [Tetraparma gracilis]
MASYSDSSTLSKGRQSFDVTPATRGVYARFDKAFAGLSDRDALTRSAITAYPDGSVMEVGRSIKDARYPIKKKKKVIRVDVKMSAFWAKPKPTSTPASPVSVCYYMTAANPKFTGVAAVLNRIAAKAATKATVMPLISMKERVEKVLADYDPDAGSVPLAEVAFKGFNHNGEYDPSKLTEMDKAKKEEAEKLQHEWWMGRMNPKNKWVEMLKEDESRLDNGISGYHVNR